MLDRYDIQEHPNTHKFHLLLIRSEFLAIQWMLLILLFRRSIDIYDVFVSMDGTVIKFDIGCQNFTYPGSISNELRYEISFQISIFRYGMHLVKS